MYINFMNEENKNLYISYWLLLITCLVSLMIIVGGLTRLTDSGLSITKWDLIHGILPPLTSESWKKYFLLYKKIPEYTLINSSMNIDHFKTIFWWEYIHRLLGRIIGLFYFIPLVYISFKKLIKKNLLISLYLILLLIFFQGFIGWFMVQSGLTKNTDVSHYRLAIHLILAFIIFILLLWNYLKLKYKVFDISNKKLPWNLPIFFIFCILIQITLGALVSGLDAGQIYQSWPLMNQGYFPDDSNFKDLLTLNSFETPSLVQFMHRIMAYILFLFFLIIGIIIFKNNDYAYLRKITLLTFIILLFQIFLGILTVLSGAQIILASMHQIGSIILITASLILVFKNNRIN